MRAARSPCPRLSSVRQTGGGRRRIWCRPQVWELREERDSRACHDDHLHDTLSVGQILQGTTQCRFAGRRQWLRAGDVVCFPAFAVHSCNPAADGEWGFRMLHLDTGWLEAHQAQAPGLAGLARDRRTAGRCFDRLARVARLAGDRGMEKTEALHVDTRLLELVQTLTISPWEDRRNTRPSATTRMVRTACEYLHAHACDPVGLAELAAAAGCGAWPLLRGFQRELGVTPHAMQQSLRVQHARRWLQQGMPLADAALQAGFADQSHFTHVFRRHTSLTPGRYRRALRAG